MNTMDQQVSAPISQIINPMSREESEFGFLNIDVLDPTPFTLMGYIDPILQEAGRMDSLFNSVLANLKARANEYISQMNPTSLNTFQTLSGRF